MKYVMVENNYMILANWKSMIWFHLGGNGFIWFSSILDNFLPITLYVALNFQGFPPLPSPPLSSPLLFSFPLLLSLPSTHIYLVPALGYILCWGQSINSAGNHYSLSPYNPEGRGGGRFRFIVIRTVASVYWTSSVYQALFPEQYKCWSI